MRKILFSFISVQPCVLLSQNKIENVIVDYDRLETVDRDGFLTVSSNLQKVDEFGCKICLTLVKKID